MIPLTISIKKIAGVFAEDKDIARKTRVELIVPALHKNREVILDFKDVEGATQSFIHALISDLIRTYGPSVLDVLVFKNCNQTIQKIISIVTEYMQETS